jgi:hypothetical protein
MVSVASRLRLGLRANIAATLVSDLAFRKGQLRRVAVTSSAGGVVDVMRHPVGSENA